MMKGLASLTNPFLEYIELVEQKPNSFSKPIKQQVEIQKQMLKEYDFIEEKGAKAVAWIERFCILPEGENKGKTVKLLLWQKWFIYSILCFYGWFEEPELDLNTGAVIGTKRIYSRVVNDVSLIVASGNAKTTTISFLLAYFMYQKEFNNPNIFIGSNTHQQARLTFDAVVTTVNNSPDMKRNTRIVDSKSKLYVKQNSAMLFAMSSKGENQEGINPAVIFNDEIHLYKDNQYVQDLKKSTKRSDLLYMEASTQGTVRGGYLDNRIAFLKENLERDYKQVDKRVFCALYIQDEEAEIYEAYDTNNPSLLLKSNPSLSYAISFTQLKNRIERLKADASTRVSILTKNFNIPQNPETCYFTEAECRTKSFNEEIFYNAPVFLGLDMAYTRNPENDLTAISIMLANPITNERYYKDLILLPKYFNEQKYINGELKEEKKDMVKAKSKFDANIPYNEKRELYGYEKYAERGDVVIVDENLVDELVSLYGEAARCDCCGITQEFVIYFIAYLQKKYNFKILKFGLDPNKASVIESFMNAQLPSLDDKEICVKFQMEKATLSNPILESVKANRAAKNIYCNNKLSELHFADAEYKETSNGFKLVNQYSKRKDAVISQVAAESAFNVLTTNKFSGADNMAVLKEWWLVNGEKINELAKKEK